MIDGPVLVTVVPASTANCVAVPSPTVGWTDAANAAGAATIPPNITKAAAIPTASNAESPRQR